MEKVSMVAPSAPMPEQEMFQQMPNAPPTYAQAMAQQQTPYPVQPVMPMPMPAQPPVAMPPANYVSPVPMAAPPQPYPQQPATHVATTTTVFVGTVPVGPKPLKMNCPICHANIKTSIVTENQASAHVCCVILCLLGCCLCSCIPYCMDSYKIVRHSCPSCKAYLGTYKP